MQMAANQHMGSRHYGQILHINGLTLFRCFEQSHGEMGIGRARFERRVEARGTADRGELERSAFIACKERFHDIDVLGARDGARGEDDVAARGDMRGSGLQKLQAGLGELVDLLGV